MNEWMDLIRINDFWWVLTAIWGNTCVDYQEAIRYFSQFSVFISWQDAWVAEEERVHVFQETFHRPARSPGLARPSAKNFFPAYPKSAVISVISVMPHALARGRRPGGRKFFLENPESAVISVSSDMVRSFPLGPESVVVPEGPGDPVMAGFAEGVETS
jgi:hypothetical protein